MRREKAYPLAGSILLHLLLIGLLSFSISHKPVKPAATPPAVEVVEAVAVDDARVQAELKRLQDKEKKRKAQLSAEKQRAEKAKKSRQAEERRLKALKKKQAEEKRKRQAEEKKRKTEQQRLAKIKQEQVALQKKQEEEKQRLAELEKQRKIEAEKKRKAEEEAKRKAEEEAKRKAEEEAKRKAEEDRKRREQEMLAKMAAEEEHRRQLVRNRQLTSLRLQYTDLIADKVRRNWTRPVGSPDSFSCKVVVQQIPGGEVVGVQLLESCGNAALDRSVESAVRKASPLPKPPDPELFDREIVFTFEP